MIIYIFLECSQFPYNVLIVYVHFFANTYLFNFKTDIETKIHKLTLFYKLTEHELFINVSKLNYIIFIYYQFHILFKKNYLNEDLEC